MNMRFFDLHCDTLTVCCDRQLPLLNKETEVSLAYAEQFRGYRQIFAVFIPDTLRGQVAVDYFLKNIVYFQKQPLPYALHPILSVEGGCVLAGDPQNVALLRENGVKLLTLTWNADNEIGSGVAGSGGGLTRFGRSVIPLLEQSGIVVDVSHLNDAGFADVAAISSRPFVASHSNARALCPHPRNLTDAQFAVIRDRGGLVGINFHRWFLTLDGRDAGFEAVRRHIEHFLALGGESVLAIGSDFDGAEIDPALAGTACIPRFWEYLSRYFSKGILEAIFYENAARFFARWTM